MPEWDESDEFAMGDMRTVEQAAEFLKITPRAVRNAINQGKLPARTVGGVADDDGDGGSKRGRMFLVYIGDLYQYRARNPNRQGWQKRKAPDYTPSKAAEYARDYRARKKAAQTAKTTDEESRNDDPQ